MPYQQEIKELKADTLQYCILDEEDTITYAAFLELLQSDESFLKQFIDLLSEIPFRAYQWEVPPVSNSTLSRPFEFVVTKSPDIDLPPDPYPFQSYFKAGKDVAVFKNLGGDATLIAPTLHPKPEAESASFNNRSTSYNYSHIGVFTKYSPLALQQNLWKTVGRTMEQALEEAESKKESLAGQPIWLNTAGGGVAWLHIRLDTRPKYYRYLPYKKWDKNSKRR